MNQQNSWDGIAADGTAEDETATNEAESRDAVQEETACVPDCKPDPRHSDTRQSDTRQSDDWNVDNEWGQCPVCGRNDGLLNVGRKHWFRCDIHRIAWSPGENIFSSWRQELETQHRQNEVLLASYEMIETAAAYNSPSELPEATCNDQSAS